MILGNCKFCRKEFRKREKKYQFCSLICSSRFNKNGLKPINLPRFNEELAEFFGICLGDGCAWGYQVSVTLHSELDKDYIPFVVSLTQKLFPGVRITLIKKPNEKAIDVRISSKIVTDFMKDMGIISHNKQVADWIFTNKKYIKACLRGLIDTDGSFIWHRYKVKGKEYSYPKISFTNKSENLLKFVFDGLTTLGFNPKRSYKFQVWLHNKDEVKNYLNLVESSNLKANIKLIS